MDQILLNIITHSGKARTYSIEAIQSAKIGEFEKSSNFIIKANEELGYAYNSQTTLIQGEAMNEKIEFSLLLAHAQDSLMTAMTFKDLANEIIDLNKKIGQLEKTIIQAK